MADEVFYDDYNHWLYTKNILIYNVQLLKFSIIKVLSYMLFI